MPTSRVDRPHAPASKRRPWLLALLAPLVCIATWSSALADDDDDRDNDGAYAIGLWGDLPDSPAQATIGVPNLIADMNAHRLKFTAHDGDLKAGSGSPCDDALYARALGYFNALNAPAMFTPGDNDWTDCDRPSNGGYSSRERLDRERAVFFSTPFSMGQRRLRQEVQAGALCLGVTGFVPCVENRRWTVGRVTYATLNLPGSCNNLCDVAFRKPVAYMHGDSHGYRVDEPLLDAAGRRLENFTRVETFGDNAANGTNDVQWIKVNVDPPSREVFAYEAMIVPVNRVAVPAP